MICAPDGSVVGAATPDTAAFARHVDVAGVPIFDGCMDDAVEWCSERIRSRSGGRVATANLDFLALARNNPQLRLDLHTSDLVVADGMPVVWLARWMGARRVARVPGVDLVPAVLRHASERSPSTIRTVLYGASHEVATSAADHIASRTPRVVIADVISPPFRVLTELEENELLGRVISADPHVVLVALGCPGQERLIARWSAAFPNALWLGVGGTFDFLAGRRKRAPRLVQQAGFEWAFRMAQEPGRLGRRYVGRDIPALVTIGKQCFQERLTSG